MNDRLAVILANGDPRVLEVVLMYPHSAPRQGLGETCDNGRLG